MADLSQVIVRPYRNHWPQVHETAFVAPGVVLVGDIVIGANSNIWFGSVLRGDVNVIRIGENTNIQDGTVIHGTRGSHGTIIGSNVTVGHCVLLHDCTVEDNAFIGMKSCMMDGSKVERHAMLAAGSLLTEGKLVKTGQVWVGSPARYWRELRADEYEMIDTRAPHYVELSKEYMK